MATGNCPHCGAYKTGLEPNKTYECCKCGKDYSTFSNYRTESSVMESQRQSIASNFTKLEKALEIVSGAWVMNKIWKSL